MPRYKRSQSTIDSPFSTWHRRQHDGVNMTDIDVVGICPACAAPLFIADTIYNIDFRLEAKTGGIKDHTKYWLKDLTFHIMKYSIPLMRVLGSEKSFDLI